MSYNQFDVVLVLFPFTEKEGQKQRPAVVLSGKYFNDSHSHIIAAMVTTAGNTKWPSDLSLQRFKEAGLRTASFMRAKIFTISYDVVRGRVGTLAETDSTAVSKWIGTLIRQ